MFPHGETVVVHPLEEGGTDRYGNPVPGWGDDRPVHGCGVAPRVEEQDVDGNRSAVVYGFQVFAPFEVEVGPHDELTVRGVRCVVDGEIARWRTPFTGREPGAVILVKRVDG